MTVWRDCLAVTLTLVLSHQGRGEIGGCVVVYVCYVQVMVFQFLSDSVQSMKLVCVHRREYGACWFFVFIQLPLFPPRAPGFAARGTSRRRKFRKASNPPSGINASIRPSQRPLPRRTRPFGTSECETCLCAAFPLLLQYGPCLRVVACDALCGRSLKAFCRCPGNLRASRRRRFLLFFTVSYRLVKWFDIRWQFQRPSTCISRPLLFLSTPCLARRWLRAHTTWLGMLALRYHIVLIVHDVLYCQEYYDNCFWGIYVCVSCFVAWMWWIADGWI